ncbi:uncharacterized protein LOC133179350 [Saccostrea echinata]|uniref:uncharacterized protein LOC133179350 n=1 Tax=Saccostrea echinata TaxID=191078 RepID=UPI002A7EFA32|nr:uncharacterized protein LOC133179350 [Saccostrea echinata]
MKFYLSVICVYVFLPDLQCFSTRTLTFEDDRCYGPFNPTPRESFKVIHTGEESSSICRDMSFNGWDDVDKLSRESCVRVEEYKLQCPQKLVYRAGSNRGTPARTYDCRDTVDEIPVFCTFELLYIRIEADETKKNTEVVYTVYSGSEKQGYSSNLSAISIIMPVLVLSLLALVLTLVCCIRMKRARELQNRGGTVVFNRNQQPGVTLYQPVHQPWAQGQSQQGYSQPPQTSPPFQSYPQPSAPVIAGSYGYPSGQQFLPPAAPNSPHINEPPSYNEVINKKH